MKNVDTVKKHSLRKRIIIVISIIVIITILLISVLTRNKIRNVKKIRAEKEKQSYKDVSAKCRYVFFAVWVLFTQ